MGMLSITSVSRGEDIYEYVTNAKMLRSLTQLNTRIIHSLYLKLGPCNFDVRFHQVYANRGCKTQLNLQPRLALSYIWQTRGISHSVLTRGQRLNRTVNTQFILKLVTQQQQKFKFSSVKYHGGKFFRRFPGFKVTFLIVQKHKLTFQRFP